MKSCHLLFIGVLFFACNWLNPPKYQLYDLLDDPWEFNNLAENPQYAKEKERLIKALNQWMQDTNDFVQDPEKLKRLTQEHDSIPEEERIPVGGWKYSGYLQ